MAQLYKCVEVSQQENAKICATSSARMTAEHKIVQKLRCAQIDKSIFDMFMFVKIYGSFCTDVGIRDEIGYRNTPDGFWQTGQRPVNTYTET